ncbi:hypothetical protein BGZ98_004254, partial [Dissophora globulifera]
SSCSSSEPYELDDAVEDVEQIPLPPVKASGPGHGTEAHFRSLKRRFSTLVPKWRLELGTAVEDALLHAGLELTVDQ